MYILVFLKNYGGVIDSTSPTLRLAFETVILTAVGVGIFLAAFVTGFLATDNTLKQSS